MTPDIDALVARLEVHCSRAEYEFPLLAAPDGNVAVPFTDLRAILSTLTALSDEIAVLKEREGAGPYHSQAEAWNDALEKSAQIVERYNAAFDDPECGGAPDDIRALKRGLTDKAGS